MIVASVAVGVVLFAAFATAERRSSKPSSAFTLQVWNWTTTRRLASDEAADLVAMSTQAVCWWCGSVEREGGAPRFHVRGGRLLGGSALQEWPVIRVEPSCSPLLETAPDEIAAAVLIGWQRAQVVGMQMAGLQIDWDVPSRLLPSYARFLERLRAALPHGTGLSCTGLVTWLDAPGIAAVARAVDWWVPQCYSADLPTDPAIAEALVGRIDVGAVTVRCEKLGRPFRVGLPTFEQASVWSADGHLLAAAVPIATEEALAAGLVCDPPDQHGDDAERLLRFRVRSATSLAGRQLPVDARLLIGQPTVKSLRAQIDIVRAKAQQWCVGISLFRMPRPGDMPCLSTRQLRAAWTGTAETTSVSEGLRRSWRRDDGTWTLVLANPGLTDQVRVDQPVRLAIDGVPVLGALPAPLRLTSAIDGIPVGPAHATGSLLLIPFLRAGTAVTLAFTAVGEHPPACRDLSAEETP